MVAADDDEVRRVVAALDRGEADPATLRTAGRLLAERSAVLTERSAERDAAREAREGQERLRVAVEAAGIGVFEWDLVTGRARWNEHRARICGGDPAVLEGTQVEFGACVHPDDREEVGLQLTAAMAGRREYDQEFRIRWPDGQTRWARCRGRFQYDGRGEPLRMTGVVYDVTDRRAAEAARVAAARSAGGDQLLRAVMDQSPLAACVVDGATLVCKWVSEGFVRQTGSRLSPAQLVGRHCGEFIPGFEAAGLRALYERVVVTGEGVAHDEYEFHGLADTRGVTYWRWSLTPLPPPPGGRAPDLLIQALDVTAYVLARKRAEAEAARAAADADRAGADAARAATDAQRAEADTGALRALHRSAAESLALLDTLLAHAPIGIALVGPDYRIRLVNRAMVAITGATPADQVGRTVAEVLPDMWPRLAPLYARVLRGETVLDVEGTGRTPARPGDERTWRASLYPVRTGPPGPGGRPADVAIGVIVADETDRRRAADAARQAQNLLQTLCDHTSDPVFVKDVAGRQLLANPASVRLIGKPHDRIVGHLTEEVFDDPAIARTMRENDRRVFETDRVAVVEEVVHTPSGPRVFMVSKAPYHDAAGAVAGLVGVGRDITDRKRMEEDLRRARDAAEGANRAKDVFLSILGHELRTPLNAVLGWAQLLKLGGAEAPGAEAVAEAADGIEHSALCLARLVEDLLDVGRVVAGKMYMTAEPVDLAAVVARAAAAVRFAAVDKGVALDASAPESAAAPDPAGGPGPEIAPGPGAGPLVVTGDARRLEQVFVNLLGNAVKFTPAGGRVLLRLEAVGGHARVVVRDTGHGIPADFLPSVFDRFAQADDPPYGGDRPARPRGLGLGLSIVKTLVELHGGSVTAHSDGPGTGATFTVDLPLASRAAVAATGELPALRPGPAAATAAGGAGEAGDWAAAGAAPVAGGTGADAPPPAVPPPVLPTLRSLAGVRAVVVDDVAASRNAVAELLRRCGAEVTACASAAEAVAAVRAAPPDVLVSDLAMPGADGHELIRQVRALPPAEGGRVPAVALSGRAAGEDWLEAVVGGFNTHIAKPADAAELVRVVATLATRFRAVK